MLKLRLKRVGRKHDPSFRIVVVENTKPSKGGYLESVGFYNAMLKQLQIKKDRASYWLGVGAQPTDVVHNLLVREGVIQAAKIAVHKKAKKNKETESGGGEPTAQANEEQPATDESEKSEQPKEDKKQELDKATKEKEDEQDPDKTEEANQTTQEKGEQKTDEQET